MMEPATETARRCTKCGETKMVGAFYRTRDPNARPNFQCRACYAARREKNRTTNSEYMRQYREKDPVKVKEQKAQFYRKHAARISAEHRAYREKNRERVSERGRAYREKNRERLREYARLDKIKNPDRHRVYRLGKLYGLGKIEYEAMMAWQDHQCAICGLEFGDTRTTQGKVDHCHSTGAVRGLLCNACNIALGGFGDDSARLQAAINYLNDWPALRVYNKERRVEPVIHIQRIVDEKARGVLVENDANLYRVSSAKHLNWMEAIVAVTSYIETQQHKGRDD